MAWTMRFLPKYEALQRPTQRVALSLTDSTFFFHYFAVSRSFPKGTPRQMTHSPSLAHLMSLQCTPSTSALGWFLYLPIASQFRLGMFSFMPVALHHFAMALFA